MKVSVIIPAKDEALCIGRAIASAMDDAEVIVVDGGSTDRTREIAGDLGARVIIAGPGRGAQMDAGAACSDADALVFLHADSVLPHGWHGGVNDALSKNSVVAGAFGLSIDSPRPLYRVMERVVWLRSRVFGLMYGDQAIFVKKETFLRAGGFRRMPLMEDVDCVRRLGKEGKVVLLAEKVMTSARRWEKRGVARTTLMNWTLLFLYFAGASPEALCKRYYGAPKKRKE